MTDHLVEFEHARRYVTDLIAQTKMPFTVSITPGRRRSWKQNRLQRLWIGEIAKQTHQSTEEVRAYMKLTFGIPILKAANEAYAIAYDERIEGLPYETKLKLMMEPTDLPVTRLMTTKQHKEYLDATRDHFVTNGVVLTIPDDDGLIA